MKRHGLLISAILAGALGTASSAAADTTDALLGKLLAKGILTQAEYDELMRRKAVDEPIASASARAPNADASSASAKPDGRADSFVRTTDSGVGFQAGPVTVKFSGSVNGFYVHDSGATAGPGSTVVGGLASLGPDTSSVRNGLLPGFLKVDVTSVQNGFDVGAHFGLYPGINSVSNVGGANSAGSPTALSTSGIDARQTYLTIGRKDLGELKIGRDIGLFGSEAILNDLSLLGVGTAAGNSAPSNTSIGRIGVGYIYTDFQPQITYTSPKFGGLQMAVGVFQPLTTAGASEANSSPGFQGKLTYAFGGQGFSGQLWANALTQKHDGVSGFGGYTGSAYDLGGKLTAGKATVIGYYYNGSGVGTTGLFILAATTDGRKRDSSGYYVQGAYKVTRKLSLGASHGESRLRAARGETFPTLVSKNSSTLFQSQYALTPWINLVGEYTKTRSEAQNGNSAESDTTALGAILFF